MAKRKPAYDAWHPGLESEIPGDLLPLVTLFRPENSHISYREARELKQICGMAEEELILFRVERLVVHELLIRVTADLSIPDGPNYEDLGINLRSMVTVIFDGYVKPQMAVVSAVYDSVRNEAESFIDQQLSALIFKRVQKEPAKERTSFFSRLFGGSSSKKNTSTITELPEIEAIELWQEQLKTCENPLEKACLSGLIKIVGSITGHRGRIIADKELITRLAANLVCNNYGSEKIGEALAPMMAKAIAAEKYRPLPVQEKPVVLNVKGASASGKSTIRPQQRLLAENFGVPWEDFALISPDYWRKHLLDYDSLGDDYKYVAMLTGQELEIIDKKLDRYMAQKASRGLMSHLLIDRFRFDSFSLDSDGSKLLSRFGDRIFMFFMVTPPAETVERAWLRGIKTGRYKAVDDLLYHNVEAFTGMPELFFSWISTVDKRIHFEFLDNDVALGEVPKTSAFGWNNKMTILDVKVMIDIERYRKVNVDAKTPAQIFNARDMKPVNNVDYIQRCADQVSEILFADQDSAYVYARIVEGELVWCDPKYIEKQTQRSGVKVALEVLGYSGKAIGGESDASIEPIDVEHEKRFTLGRWN
ncbi:MAG: hypothetical protein COB78_01040 [Hyphomicrobiales bacterium]|nr:MAG: hypothetical protein COB78_01040 [Hyphomicrobiales bacterium]